MRGEWVFGMVQKASGLVFQYSGSYLSRKEVLVQNHWDYVGNNGDAYTVTYYIACERASSCALSERKAKKRGPLSIDIRWYGHNHHYNFWDVEGHEQDDTYDFAVSDNKLAGFVSGELCKAVFIGGVKLP